RSRATCSPTRPSPTGAAAAMPSAACSTRRRATARRFSTSSTRAAALRRCRRGTAGRSPRGSAPPPPPTARWPSRDGAARRRGPGHTSTPSARPLLSTLPYHAAFGERDDVRVQRLQRRERDGGRLARPPSGELVV